LSQCNHEDKDQSFFVVFVFFVLIDAADDPDAAESSRRFSGC